MLFLVFLRNHRMREHASMQARHVCCPPHNAQLWRKHGKHCHHNLGHITYPSLPYPKPPGLLLRGSMMLEH